jgi:hypothetical protein
MFLYIIYYIGLFDKMRNVINNCLYLRLFNNLKGSSLVEGFNFFDFIKIYLLLITVWGFARKLLSIFAFLAVNGKV